MSATYTITWENHRQVVEEAITSMLQRRGQNDHDLIINQQILPVHKAMLIACSDYFKTLLLGDEKNYYESIVTDIDYNTMELIVEFMYEGKIRINESIMKQVLQGAQTLKIKGLMGLHVKYFNSDLKNARELHVQYNGHRTKVVKNPNTSQTQLCPYCDEAILNKKHTKRHIELCKRIYKVAITKTAYKADGDPYQHCPYCNETFQNKSQEQMKTHWLFCKRRCILIMKTRSERLGRQPIIINS